MVCFSWVMHQTENLFDFSWLCGSFDHVASDETTSVKMNRASFVQNVWSGLEYENSTFQRDDDEEDDDDDDTSDNSRESRGDTEDWSDLGETNDDSTKASTVLSCQEPQERGSNIPVLRQLPSFGSTLRSSSLQSGIHASSGGLSSYPTRSSSTESVTRTTKEFGVEEEESPVHVKTQFFHSVGDHKASHNHSVSNSFIFLRQ